MIYDLDQLIQCDATQEHSDDRLFAFDLFISHRRFDRPVECIKALARHDVRAVWDHDLDMRDMRVVHAINRAMQQSRYIGLFVSDEYTDSDWCKAEYLGAVKFEEQYGVSRALVILQSRRGIRRIPPQLRMARRFMMTDAGLTKLAAFVRRGNRAGVDETAEERLQGASRDSFGAAVRLLSTLEQLTILERRLKKVVHHRQRPTNVSARAEAASQLMTTLGEPFSEIENVIRGMSSLILTPYPGIHPRANIGSDELRRVIAIANLIARSYSPDAEQVSGIRAAEIWLWDYLLKPLLAAVMNEQTKRPAMRAYAAVCAGMESGRDAPNVPVYRAALEATAKKTADPATICRRVMIDCVRT